MSAPPGYHWVEASNEALADLMVHIHRKVKDEVARIGPGLGGRWFVLFGPRAKRTPPHRHRVHGITWPDDHPMTCTSPACWTRTVLISGGEMARLDDDGQVDHHGVNVIDHPLSHPGGSLPA